MKIEFEEKTMKKVVGGSILTLLVFITIIIGCMIDWQTTLTIIGIILGGIIFLASVVYGFLMLLDPPEDGRWWK